MAVWKFFCFGEIREAEAWARDGGYAVHDTGFPFRRWDLTAHLFALNTQELTKAIRLVGANPKWIQYPGHPTREHFDLMGKPLDMAVALCVNGASAEWCDR